MPSGRSSTSSTAASPGRRSSPEAAARRDTLVLGAGALGLAWALTTTAAYLPPILGRYTDSTTLVGLVLAAEGFFALTLPLVIGPWSDTFHTPLGRRRPFMLAALGPMAFALALLAFMPNLWTTALLLFALFFAYYVYEPPYRGLYPDVLPDRVFGRAQGVQHVFRGIAIAGGLIGGGFLFHLWRPAPFLVAAAVVSVACLVPIVLVTEDGGHGRVFEGVRTYVAHSWQVLRSNRDVATFLVANTAWEGTFAGARTFVVLYVTVGLDEPLVTSTYILGAVAAGYIVAALLAGRIGDRVGLARVITVASAIYGVGLLAGGLGREWHGWYLVVIFLVAIAGGTVMTLAWGLLFKLMPPGERGAISGLATTTKGIGLVIGPLAAGAVIDILGPYLESTEGYQALWPVLGVPIILAIPFVARLARAEAAANETLADET
ncbi:MAG TPA: MFS transporter [Gaiella sp.]|uniref:MFS transporter n=1 Tax=Gaiella sp. TaxID=2663207 RepID=UPI002D80AEE2|nr:MFS transporter [Gaiella sp.]HET9286577.1 MFS transporter [Gaiella sp.]